MRYLLTALVLAAPLASGAAPANVCNVSDIIDCNALAKAPVDLSGTQGFPKFKDGRQIFNTLAASNQQDSPKFLKAQEPTPKQLLDLNKNVARIKKRVREFLRAGRSDSWIEKSQEPEAVELRAIFKRLDLITIGVADSDNFECSEMTPTGFPNAFNELARNKIMLCPAAAKQSVPWLTRTIAHELSHMFGPCAMEKPLFIAKKESDLSAGSCFGTSGTEEDSELSNSHHGFGRLLKSVKSGEVTSIVENRAAVSEIISCGVFEEAPEASVPRENRKLFGHTSQCLDTLYAPEYEAELKKNVERNLAAGIINASQTKQAEAQRRAQNPLSCHIRANEHFADTFAARFTAHVAEEDGWSKNDLRISLIDDAIAVCAAEANLNHLHPKMYPSAKTRLSVALNEPIVRERLNCAAETNTEKLCSQPLSSTSAQRSGAQPSTSSRGNR